MIKRMRYVATAIVAVATHFVATAAAPALYSEQVDTVSSVTPEAVAAMDRIAGEGQQRVGLVLSGGGAKGIAHIGVTKALEVNDILIDCISGTSMGAVVGGLYACGYSPEMMMELMQSKVFLNCSTGTMDPELTHFFSQPAPSPDWLTVNLSLKRDSTSTSIPGQILPSSLINPLPMNMEFLRLFAPYTLKCGEDFNRLFVPLRTVCSDVYNKHKVVLHSGSVGDAIRASMSFPTVFRPIAINGLLMYDGGIYDNFPVDVMEENFDPDFIIGVSVSGPDGKPQPGNLMNQLEDMIIQSNNYDLPAEKGVKIQVPVLEFGVLDFGRAKTIYDIGYRTGLSMVDSIRYRITARRPAADVKRRRAAFNDSIPRPLFDTVRVIGANPGQADYLKFLFTNGERRPQFGLDATQEAYYRAVSDGKLTNLVPFMIVDEPAAGQNTLMLQANVKNPWSIGVGGWLTTGTQSMLYLRLGYHTLNYNSLDVDLAGWIGQSYYAGMLSGKFTIQTRRPSYMKLEGVMSRLKFFDSQLMFYQETTPMYISEIENYLKLKYCLATGLKSIFTASFGYGWRSDKYLPEGSASGQKECDHYNGLALAGEWEYNTLNNQLYPMSGRRLVCNVIGEWRRSKSRVLYDNSSWTTPESHYSLSAEVKWQEFFPLHRRFTLGVAAQGLLTLEKLYGTYTATKIRSYAFAPTPSTANYYNPAFRSDNFVAVGLLPIWNPVDKLQIRCDLYGYLPIRDIEDGGLGAPALVEYRGWCRHPQFIGELAAVYNFKFASLSLYGNYLSTPRNNFNFGISFGLFFQAPRFTR